MPPGLKVIILVRHGECVTNVSMTLSSDWDFGGLTEKGVAQARAAGRALAPYAEEIGSLHSSPVVRARQTAGAIGDAIGLDTKVDPRLAERGLGSLNRTAFRTREEMFLRYRQATTGGREGMEEWGGLVSRMESFIGGLEPGVHVAVTHHDPVVAAASIIDKKYFQGTAHVSNASLTVLDYPREVLAFGVRASPAGRRSLALALHARMETGA